MSGPAVGPVPVVRTPLRAEWLALRGATVVPVVRTGRSRGEPVPGPDLVAGLAGSLVADVRPGDVVVATEVRGAGVTRSCAAAPLLAGALRRSGFTVHEGPVVTAPRVVDDPGARAGLAGTGALAVDTESALLAHPLGTTTVLRVVVDAPGAPLRSARMPVRGAAGLAALRRTAPVLDQWAAACGEREVVLAVGEPACAEVARETDLVVVAGAAAGPGSSARLVEVAAGAGTPAYPVDDASEVDLRRLAGVRTVGVVVGASAPLHLADRLVEALGGLGPVTVHDRREAAADGALALPEEVVP